MSDPEKQGMGCFAKGCLTLIVVFILVCGVTIGGVYYYAKRFVAELTSDKPVTIKVEQPTDAQMQAAAVKAQALSDALKAGKEVTVELTGPDLNALIARSPNLADLRGVVYFAIADNEVSGEASVPLDRIPFSMFKGRYFNGRFRTFAEFANGEVTFKPKLIEANGKALADVFLRQIASPDGQRQLNTELRKSNNREFRESLERFKSVRVVGDRLIITTRAKPPST